MPNRSEIFLILAGAMLVLGIGAFSRCVVRRRARSRRKWLALLGIVLLLGSYVSYMTPKVQRYGVYRYLPTWTLICLAPARVPESLFDECLIESMYPISGGGIPYRKALTAPMSPIEKNAFRELYDRGVLSDFHRWLWITRDQMSGAEDGTYRFILDLEDVWNSHSLDLQRQTLEIPQEFTGIGLGRSIFSANDVRYPETYKVTNLKDVGFNTSSDGFVEELLGILQYCAPAWDYPWVIEQAEEEHPGISQLLSPRPLLLDIEAYRFGTALVITGPDDQEETVRLRIRQLSERFPLDRLSPDRMTDLELEWFGEEIGIEEIRDFIDADNDRAINWNTTDLLPHVLRVYSIPKEAIVRAQSDPKRLYKIDLDFDSVFSRIRLNDQTDHSMLYAYPMQAGRLGTSLMIFAPVEFQPALARVAQLYITGELDEHGPTLVYRDGQFVPLDPNK